MKSAICNPQSAMVRGGGSAKRRRLGPRRMAALYRDAATSLATRRVSVAGYMLVECLVYISVLMILLGLGFGAFYSCWDKSKSLRYHADDISRALRAGEQWRADIRNATGRIVAHTDDDGQMVEIPRGTNTILYVFTAGEVSRKFASAEQWTVVLSKVNTSRIQADPRTRVTAWRWDVELVPTRAQVRIQPRFTFEAVPAAVQ